MSELRKQIIDAILSTQGQSEGVTADAIMYLLQQSQWRSAAERLPEIGKSVLTYSSCASIAVDYLKSGDVFTRDYCSGEPWRTTHWMPLPQPPADGVR